MRSGGESDPSSPGTANGTRSRMEDWAASVGSSNASFSPDSGFVTSLDSAHDRSPVSTTATSATRFGVGMMAPPRPTNPYSPRPHHPASYGPLPSSSPSAAAVAAAAATTAVPTNAPTDWGWMTAWPCTWHEFAGLTAVAPEGVVNPGNAVALTSSLGQATNAWATAAATDPETKVDIRFGR